jgi:hypothetical protein
MEHKKDLDFNAKLYGKQRFGFRKISVGLAAVALGTTFFLSNSQLVHADENNASQQTTEVKENAQTVDSDQQNVETKTDNSTSSEISSKDNTQESSSNNKNGDSTASQEKQNDSKLAISLAKSEADTDQPSYSSTVPATKKNNGTNLTQTTTPNNPATLASDQDTVQVDTTVNLNNVRSVTHDNPITVQIVNGDTGSTDPLMTNDGINNGGNWYFEKRTDIAKRLV